MSESSTTAQRAAFDAIFRDYNRSDAPGLLVGVAHHGEPIYRRGFGLASIEHSVANSPWTRMRIGSTSKQFTCLAILLLAEDGKLDIDDSVRKHIPELRAATPEPTIRQLMTHTSGYRDYLDLSFLSDGMAIKPKGLALASQIRQSDVNFPAGRMMMYCNGGYHLLSVIVDRASGTPFERFLQARIFEPLGMVDTASIPSDFEIHPGIASLHVPQPDGSFRRGIFPTEEVRGEGAMVSTIDDMMRWMKHMNGPKTVGNDASWASMTETTRLDNGLEIPYGFGLMRNMYRGVETVHHAGGLVGGSCQMLTVPSKSLDIIIMANWTTRAPVDLANQVIDAVLMTEALEQPQPKAQTARFKNLVGKRYYAPSTGFVVGFTDMDGTLGMAALNMPAVPVRDEGDSLRLGFEDMAAGPLVFDTSAASEADVPPDTLSISEAGHAETFVRLSTVAPLAAELAEALAGSYRAEDLDATARVELRGDTLTLTIQGTRGLNVMTLEPYADDVLGWETVGADLPLSGILVVERAGSRVDSLRIETMRSRHIVLKRV